MQSIFQAFQSKILVLPNCQKTVTYTLQKNVKSIRHFQCNQLRIMTVVMQCAYILFNRRKPRRTIELVWYFNIRLGIQTKYSKASRYAASRTADLADMRVQIFRGFYEDFTQFFFEFWGVFWLHEQRLSRYTFFSENQNLRKWGFAFNNFDLLIENLVKNQILKGL